MTASAARVASALSVATARCEPSAAGWYALLAGSANVSKTVAALAPSSDTVRDPMRFVYVMDPISRVLPDKDTTFAFQRAAQARGHVSLHCEPRDVYIDGSEVGARVRELRVSDQAPYFEWGETHDVRFHEVEAVFIRKDPPFDSRVPVHDAHARTRARPHGARERPARPPRREREALHAAFRASTCRRRSSRRTATASSTS